MKNKENKRDILTKNKIRRGHINSPLNIKAYFLKSSFSIITSFSTVYKYNNKFVNLLIIVNNISTNIFIFRVKGNFF